MSGHRSAQLDFLPLTAKRYQSLEGREGKKSRWQMNYSSDLSPHAGGTGKPCALQRVTPRRWGCSTAQTPGQQTGFVQPRGVPAGKGDAAVGGVCGLPVTSSTALNTNILFPERR